jgi:O-antigen/teichoic acid export membrane protein
LGPAGFGPLSGAIGIAIVVAAFGDFGINGWAIRALARNPSSIERFRQTLTAKLTVATLLAFVWIMIALATLQGSSLRLPVVLLGGYLLTLVVAGTLTVPFRASENMTVVSIVGAVEKAVALGVSLVAQALVGYQPEVLPIALLVGGGASVGFALALIPRHLLAIEPPSIRAIVELWRSSYSFGMVGVSAQILRADTAIVNAFSGSYAAGVYAAPARLTSFLAVIPASFSAAVFPRIVRSSAHGTSQRPEILGACVMLAVMVLLLVTLAIAAPVLILLTLGPAYSASVLVFRIFLIVVLLNAANQPLLALMQAEGREHYAGWVLVASAVIGLVTIGWGAYIGGAAGAAVGALILQMLQLVLLGSMALRRPHSLRATNVVADVRDGDLEVHMLLPEVVDDAASS